MTDAQGIVIAAAFVAAAVFVTREAPPANAVLDMSNIGPWQMQVTAEALMAWRINTKTGAIARCLVSGANVLRKDQN